MGCAVMFLHEGMVSQTKGAALLNDPMKTPLKPRLHRLGDLQLRILRILGDRGEASVAGVADALGADRGWPAPPWPPCSARWRNAVWWRIEPRGGRC